MLISYQCEDIDEREKDKEICKSWREVEVVAVAEEDGQTDEIACEKHLNGLEFVFVAVFFVFVAVFFVFVIVFLAPLGALAGLEF